MDNLPAGLDKYDIDHIFGCETEEEIEERERAKEFLEDLEIDSARGK